VTSRRSRSPYKPSLHASSVSDLSNSLTTTTTTTTTNHPGHHYPLYKPRSLSDISGVTSPAPRSRGTSQDAYIVGYATVKTHERPAGSEGVNYKVFLNQVPVRFGLYRHRRKICLKTCLRTIIIRPKLRCLKIAATYFKRIHRIGLRWSIITFSTQLQDFILRVDIFSDRPMYIICRKWSEI